VPVLGTLHAAAAVVMRTFTWSTERLKTLSTHDNPVCARIAMEFPVGIAVHSVRTASVNCPVEYQPYSKSGA
jgi:hypothetical protein